MERRGILKERVGTERECNKCGETYRLNQSGTLYCNRCTFERMSDRRKRCRAVVELIRTIYPCQCCGENDPVVKDFHHIDPSTKWRKDNRHKNTGYQTGGLCGLVWSTGSLSAIIREMNKCALLCANCHRRVEAGAINNASLAPLDLPIPPRGNRHHGDPITRWFRDFCAKKIGHTMVPLTEEEAVLGTFEKMIAA